jgi:U4/U6 small nuclear ribonucleoprotein PRP4
MVNQPESFYTEASKSLLDARMDITTYSLAKAAVRIQCARRRRIDEDVDHSSDKDWTNFNLELSEIGDDRPFTGCSFSRDGKRLATCSLNGGSKLWSMPTVKKVSSFKGHTVHATDVAYSPVQQHSHLATASADRTAKYWNDQGSLLRTFEGHRDRLARIAFHPSGKYLGTASFDKTWRLWDLEKGDYAKNTNN